MKTDPPSSVAQFLAKHFGEQWKAAIHGMDERLLGIFSGLSGHDLWAADFDLVSGLAEVLDSLARGENIRESLDEGLSESWLIGLCALALAKKDGNRSYTPTEMGLELVRLSQSAGHLEGSLVVWLRELGVRVPDATG